MFTTTHRHHTADARDLTRLANASVQLVVTSPPYPMVQMWDDAFAALSPAAQEHREAGRGWDAFAAMHAALDAVWAECVRVLQPGGFACVNVGDATRSVGGDFALYPNHVRISTALQRLGMTPLPDILWRKPTNAPNKFMGSGMLPAGAYVTYEHEYVLVFRKGGKRRFSAVDKVRRARSAFFWEERNVWFSDLWADLPGTRQRLKKGSPRQRSGAFPLALPYRLIQMYSLQEDTVLDPFVGTGTTAAAALASGRSSVGVERLPGLAEEVEGALQDAVHQGAALATRRLADHAAFAQRRLDAGKPCKHASSVYGFPVMTRQERSLALTRPVALAALTPGAWEVEHALAQPA